MSKKTGDKSSHWQETAFKWAALALVAGGIVAAVPITNWVLTGTGSFGLKWIWTPGAVPAVDSDMLTRSRIVTPLVPLYIALVTFCTVFWRGLINSRQAAEQKRQNDATDASEVSGSLEKAVELLSTNKELEQRLALSMLEAVKKTRKRAYVTMVQDIIDVTLENSNVRGSKLTASVPATGLTVGFATLGVQNIGIKLRAQCINMIESGIVLD